MPLPNADSFDTYGGEKQNYSDIVNVKTDWTAENVNNAFAATAQMTRTALRGFVRFVAGSSPTLAASNSYESTWRADTTTLPIIAHTGTGIYTITLPANVQPPIGEPITLNLRSALAGVEGTTFSTEAKSNISSANQITVNTGLSGSANDLSGLTIAVWFV